MRILKYIKDIFSRESTQAKVKDLLPTGGSTILYPSGRRPLNVATVYRCVDLLAGSVANLRLQYMRRKGDVFVEDTSSRLHYLLAVQPCPYMSAVDFWRQVVCHMLLRGNAYIIPVYDQMELDRLELAAPSCVAHDTYTDTYTVNDVTAGIHGVFRENEIIHIKNFTVDGKTGIPTITYAATTLAIAGTGENETLNRFENGGNVRGLVGNDTGVRGFGEYLDEELKRTATDIDARFRRGDRIVSLPGEVKFTSLSLSSTDMQFLETRKFTVREICRFFGVHPSFVFDDTSNNYKSAEMANMAFLSNTLNPILRKIEAELHRKLVPASLCCKRKFQFDRRDLYACDLDSRARYQAQTIAAGIYTVNEWRAAENQPRVPGGDTVFVSANLKSINEASATVVNVQEPTPQD
ncbi:MAG: phage portal protein [Muribaculaceae bacterium]|nr:phage portal protein [Muribaculaceae bacterium]